MYTTNIIDFKLYNKIADRVAANNCHKKLAILATNITRYVKLNKVHSVFLKLADIASQKSIKQRMLVKCAPKLNNSIYEDIAFNTFAKSTALSNTLPIGRIISQLRRVGYAQTFVRQVNKKVGAAHFHRLRNNGLVHFTAEYFVYHYGKQLVTSKVYAKVKALFQDKPAILFPSSVALAA